MGVAAAPDYMGSNDYSAVPLLISEFSLGVVDFQIEGLTAYATLYERGGWSFGISGNLDTGRDDDVDSSVIAVMREIDTAFNLGPFISYGRGNQFLEGDYIEMKLASYLDTADAHDGSFTALGLTYALPIYVPWRFEFELETTYGSDDYMKTYFGVSEADSNVSGLAQYDASSSFRDVTLATNVGFFFSPKWGLFGRLSASRLLGDADDSPVTSVGSEYQYFAGIGVYYRF